ncbi:MAG: dihydropteroate synthase [Dehalococcoidia bacterium]|nr:dihydropteroate synthase [Dehalococcoidia bacterium]
MTVGRSEFFWGVKTYVMAALNVTPDSFSGDGVMARTAHHSSRVEVKRVAPPTPVAKDRKWIQAAVDCALRFEDEGADIIDIGGESTRPAVVYPDAKPVSAIDEMARVLPVITALKGRLSAPMSIDTQKAEVARAAAGEGVSLLNDVSMLGDPAMAAVAAETGLPIVIGHVRAKARYRDVVVDVASDLSGAVAIAERVGVQRGRIILDPGIGFAKNAGHSLEVLRRLGELRGLGFPLLVGPSRKSFIGTVLDLPVDKRLEGTAATVALAIANGADLVRVHDVQAMVRVALMADALVRGWQPKVSQ